MAAGFDRIFEPADDRLVFRIIFYLREVLLQCFSAHGQAVAMQKTVAKKHLHHRHNSTNLYQLPHQMLPARFEISQNGNVFPNAGPIIELSLIPAALAIASRCRTALVEPPSAMATVMAFSKASLVMISEGRIPRLTSSTTAAPAEAASASFSFEIADCAELLGRLIPIASIAEAMVFAVYIPPQEPGPGIAHDSTCSSSPSEIFPLEWAPTASKMETISMFRLPRQPGRIVPP